MTDFPPYDREVSLLIDQIEGLISRIDQRLEQPMVNAAEGMTDRKTRIATLARRLEDGWNRIESAERKGQETGKWTDFWLGLLREYQSLVDEVETFADAREQAALL